MRGKYEFENNQEREFWINLIEGDIDMLESNEIDEISYTNADISPALLAEALEALGYGEDGREYHKTYFFINFSNLETGKHLYIYADSLTFDLALCRGEDEE